MTIASRPGAFTRRLPPPPLAPQLLGLALGAVLSRITARHPSILACMGEQAKARLLVDVRQLSVLLVLTPATGQVEIFRRGARIDHDAAIRGDLADFLALLRRVAPGETALAPDALEIDGDPAAVLALGDAIDAAGLDLAVELAAIPGEPYQGWLRQVSASRLRRCVPTLSRRDFAQ
ncbi:SCP2 sterol-binding domain-containing protein [Paracoccus zhejiangensis]|uniref:SCP2 domain-containing protein n=1 Tax=Paracoccus zhejiangensis TaxID=1077935 RepID=A0A2H5F4U7_9RHOB|nr:SCP2 sterol-binding domain-containing protein [Paracoccus zhejiangensis]AUH66578.1 hypothetical protein CX676_19925 [Paracoccus zhejiangensis]